MDHKSSQSEASVIIDGSRCGRRIFKNTSDTRIVPHQYDTIHAFLCEFYHRNTDDFASTNRMRWNKEGFVCATPLYRLSNRAIINMTAVLVDILADRIVNNDDHSVRKDAEAYLALVSTFVANRVQERQRELEQAILDAARPDESV